MLIRFAIRRITRHWNLLLVPLLGVCLATGLFALAPLYSRAITELGLRYTMETETHPRVNIRVIESVPLPEELFRQGTAPLGDLFDYKADVAFSTRHNEYRGGRPRQFQSEGWFFYSFSELDEHATLIAGRWPRDKLPYFVPSVGGLRVDDGTEPDGRLAVRRAAADIEAVATAPVLKEMGIVFPDRVRVIRFGPQELALRVRIVGVIAANDPGEAYWMGQSQPLDGTIVIGPDGEPLFFGSLFITRPAMERVIDGIQDEPTLKDAELYHPGSAESHLAFRGWQRLFQQPVAPQVADNIYRDAQKLGFLAGRLAVNVSYSWHIVLNREAVTAGTMRDAAQNVLRMGEIVTSQRPDAQVITGLVSIIRVFLDQIAAVQAPVTFLTAGVMVLVLYYVLTTTSLALEQQANEWATVSSRGGSSFQLLFMHGVTVLFQCAVGLAVSLPVAQGLLYLLRRVGPLARLAVGPQLHIAAPPETWDYAIIAALVAAMALLLPAIPAARRTIITLQQTVARPPHRPAWSRFFLDIVLLALGAALLVRAAQLGDLRAETFTGQATLDAMTVLAPLLILTGGALLWLRLFPLLMRIIGRAAAARRGLAAPLALWGISRNPGHYAQLVLLLLGAFGLGGMASTLGATRDTAAWEQARLITGGAVRVEMEERTDLYATDWATLPDVTAVSPVFHGYTGDPDRPTTIQIVGVEPEALPAVNPAFAELMPDLLAGTPANQGGIPLPAEASRLAMWAYHQAPAGATLSLFAVLGDRWGRIQPLEMAGDVTSKDDWVRWETGVPADDGRPPWRLLGLALVSQRGTAGVIQGQVFFDDLEAIRPDNSAVALEQFETDDHEWIPPKDIDNMGETAVGLSDTLAHSGGQSLKLGYSAIETERYGTVPAGTWVDRVDPAAIPVLVSRTWAEFRRYQVGDPFHIEVILPPNIRRQRVLCEIVALVDTFPTLGSNPKPFVVGSLHHLLPAINLGATRWPLEPNEVWLSLGTPQPSAGLLDTLTTPGNGISAVHTAYERQEILRREPLPNAFSGILFGGFWVALALSLVGLGFYLMLTARRRMVSFGVLRALGWSGRDVWRLLVLEQIALAVPAVVVGLLLGVELAQVVSAFIPLVADAQLIVPIGELGMMVLGLAVGLALLLALTGRWLQQRQLARTLRLGGE